MAIYTRIEFAKKCGMPNNRLAIYISRGKVDLMDNGMVDMENHKNKSFYQKRISKTGVEVDDSEIIPTEPVIIVDEPAKKRTVNVKSSGNESLFELDLKKKRVDIELKEAEIRLKNIEEQKKLGELIPVDIVKTMMMTQAQSQVTSFKDAMDLFLVRISAKKKLTLEETAELKGGLIELINKAIDTSVENSKKTMRKIIDELSE